MTVPHPDDEQLSAFFDGEGDAAAAAHLRSCRECERRLADLDAVATQVCAPVPLPGEDVRRAAVAAAREAWSAELGVATLDGRRRPPRWALPVAAAAAALLAAVPLLGSLRDGTGGARTGAIGDRAGSAARGAGEVATFDGGDLGDQSDPSALALAVRGALPGAASEAELAAPQPAPAGGGAAEGAGTPDASPPRQGSGTPTAGSGQGARAGPFVDPPCAATARDSYGKGLGPLLYAARVRWEGEPAVVLGYRLAEAGGPGLDFRVLVMALDGCRLLVAESL